MRTSFSFAAAAVLLLAGATAARAEGPAAVEAPFQARTIYAAPLTAGTGSDAYPVFGAGPGTAYVQAELLPSNGSEGIVQTAASLPHGFAEGTVDYTQGVSVQHYLLAQARIAATRVAAR